MRPKILQKTRYTVAIGEFERLCRPRAGGPSQTLTRQICTDVNVVTVMQALSVDELELLLQNNKNIEPFMLGIPFAHALIA